MVADQRSSRQLFDMRLRLVELGKAETAVALEQHQAFARRLASKWQDFQGLSSSDSAYATALCSAAAGDYRDALATLESLASRNSAADDLAQLSQCSDELAELLRVMNRPEESGEFKRIGSSARAELARQRVARSDRLGYCRLAYPEPVALRARLDLTNEAFVSKVGGVAFSGSAILAGNIQRIQLVWDRDRPDGQRLRAIVRLNSGESGNLRVDAYDWEWEPVAKYVFGGGESCVSIFGDLRDESLAQMYRDRDAKIVNYDAALKDTLIGMRLLQADLLLIAPETASTPINRAGEVMASKGETIAVNKLVLDSLTKSIEALLRKHGQWTSYVICDKDQKVVGTPGGDLLELTGDPVWYCWRSIRDQNFERLRLEFERLRDSQARRQRDEFLRRAHAILESEKLGIEPQLELSRAVTTAVLHHQDASPAVLRSLQVTMRLSALFRNVQASDATSVENLLNEFRAVERSSPEIDTPSVLFEM
jgi:hypothetical protein